MNDLDRFYAACASFYDEDYAAAGYDHDVAFYVETARESGGPVLELGCGTGRVLLSTAHALPGSEVVGVDASAPMLARLEQRLAEEPEAVRRRVRLLEGDVRTVDGRSALEGGTGGFALVTAPFRVVQHLVEAADQRAWLRNVARNLAPGGHLLFDAFQPDYAVVAEEPSTAVDIERIDPATGRTVRRVASARHHPESQTFDVEFEWLVEEEDGEERLVGGGETTLRWFTRAELELLLEIEGFEVAAFWGDFDRTPFGPGAEAQVVLARRRG